MSRLDVIIFGATGFTGKHAVAELARIAKKYPGLTWAVAGRSEKKLDDILAEMSKKSGEDLLNTKKIIADVGDEQSLKEMCSQAKVLVNCCGPYRMYGEPVVKACVDTKTNYVDVSGEPQFIETMQLEYGKAARDADIFIVNACGFDSIPNDLGVIFLQDKFEGTVNSVESYISVHIPPEYSSEAKKSGTINYGTWESIVQGLTHWNELGPLRKKLFSERLPAFNPKLQPRGVIHKKESAWCVPFPGADASIVYRTQRHLWEESGIRPAQFKVYVAFPTLLYALLTVLVGLLIYCMTSFDCTRRLLLQHPRLFSLGLVTREGPSDAVQQNTHFEVELTGRGWKGEVQGEPDKTLTVKVRGVNPGYGATVTALLYSALTVLRERDNMPAHGGVYTTGVAFKNTNLMKKLNENNLTFEVVE